MWLLRATGDPNRRIRIEIDPVTGEDIIRPASTFHFPACKACNNSYGTKLESHAKKAIEALSAGKSLQVSQCYWLLDWLDKVRIGLWVAFNTLHKEFFQPKFRIDQRLGKKDRIAIISVDPNDKALIDDGTRMFIAKFSASNDAYSVVKAEFIAMTLARACGLNVATAVMSRTAKKDVLLIERFDRQRTNDGWTRRAIVSALTMLGLDEMMARYASYEDLAKIIRYRFNDHKDTLKELYGRMCFNVLCGNTDDHARNHSAFWDGRMLTLTPAYDICPQGRTGNEATQAMLIKGDNRASNLSTLLAAAPDYHLKETEAAALIEHQIKTIAEHWQEACAQAELSPVDRTLFAGRQFLNGYAIEGLKTHKALQHAFLAARNALIASDGA
jgi:hypothetical protein